MIRCPLLQKNSLSLKLLIVTLSGFHRKCGKRSISLSSVCKIQTVYTIRDIHIGICPFPDICIFHMDRCYFLSLRHKSDFKITACITACCYSDPFNMSDIKVLKAKRCRILYICYIAVFFITISSILHDPRKSISSDIDRWNLGKKLTGQISRINAAPRQRSTI